MNLWIILFLVISALAAIRLLSATEHPVRTAFSVMASGCLSLLVVGLTSQYTGVTLATNEYTAAFSALYGIPGVISLLAANLILGL